MRACLPQPADRFRFRFVRAGGRVGDRSVDVRSDLRQKDGDPPHFPFSLFGLGVFPFSLVSPNEF